jgi:hypothetical protein
MNKISSCVYFKGKYAIKVKKKIVVGKSARKKVNDKAEALVFKSLFPSFLIKNSNTAYKETSFVPGIGIEDAFLYNHFTGLVCKKGYFFKVVFN